jgi:hypothetical protein
LKQHGRPVVVLHHEATDSNDRFLTTISTTSSTSNSTIPISEVDISQYQICLWTAVVFVLLGLGSIFSIVNMDVVPDSLLYAKFQSGRTEKRD